MAIDTENGDQSGGLDMRVDDSRDPVGELTRLSLLAKANALRSDAVGPDGLYRNIPRLREALSIAPEDQASLGALGLALLRAGHLDEAAHLLKRLSVLEPRTAERLTRLVNSGRLDPVSGATVLAAIRDQADA